MGTPAELLAEEEAHAEGGEVKRSQPDDYSWKYEIWNLIVTVDNE